MKEIDLKAQNENWRQVQEGVAMQGEDYRSRCVMHKYKCETMHAQLSKATKELHCVVNKTNKELERQACRVALL